MTEPRNALLEREWIGQAIKHARITRGLKQRELVELIQTAGLQWTQGILAKVELGTREVTLSELLLICVCLGTTPEKLLYHEELHAEYLQLPSGKLWNIGALGELFDKKPLTGDLAVTWSYPGQPKNAINPEDVLEVASNYLIDPDAVTIGAITGLEAAEVTSRVSQIAAQVLAKQGYSPRKRRKWTARDLIDLIEEEAIAAEEEAGKELSEHAKRAIRNSITKRLARLIIGEEWTEK